MYSESAVREIGGAGLVFKGDAFRVAQYQMTGGVEGEFDTVIAQEVVGADIFFVTDKAAANQPVFLGVDRVAARVADGVVAVDVVGVDTFAADHQVVIRPAAQDVGTVAAVKGVVARPAIEGIAGVVLHAVASPACDQEVVPVTAVQGVLTHVAHQRVGLAATGQSVVAVAAQHEGALVSGGDVHGLSPGLNVPVGQAGQLFLKRACRAAK